MKKYYYICNKCIDNQEVECYTIGIIGPKACEVCRKEFEPKNMITIANKHLVDKSYLLKEAEFESYGESK